MRAGAVPFAQSLNSTRVTETTSKRKLKNSPVGFPFGVFSHNFCQSQSEISPGLLENFHVFRKKFSEILLAVKRM